MIVKKHADQGRLVLAACDTELLGSIYEEDELVLDLSSEYYSGEEVSEEDFSQMLKMAYVITAVGQDSVRALIQRGMASEQDVKKIAGIPYLMILVEG